MFDVGASVNAFGAPVPAIAQIIGDPRHRKHIEARLGLVLGHLGFTVSDARAILGEIINRAEEAESLDHYEAAAHRLLEKNGVLACIPDCLRGRAQQIFGQIRKHVAGGAVLDLGCGDGRVGGLLAEDGGTVTLADRYLHENINLLPLPFVLLDDDVLPFADGHFGTVLLLTVLHHCNRPLALLGEAGRVLTRGGTLVVIESVYGIEPGPKQRSSGAQFGGLSTEEQRVSNIFFDHFYNRVVHYSALSSEKVNVPFNFNTPDGWRRTFAEHGFTETWFEELGIDQPVVPEYHTLHVLKRR